METKTITVRGKEYNVNPSKVKELCDTTNQRKRVSKEPVAFDWIFNKDKADAGFRRLYNHSVVLKTGNDIDYDSITDEMMDKFVRQFE